MSNLEIIALSNLTARGIFFNQLFPNWTAMHTVLLSITCTVQISLQKSKTFDHVLVLFHVFFVHVMTSLPFNFFFLQHRKPSVLVSLAKVQKNLSISEKILEFSENGLQSLM